MAEAVEAEKVDEIAVAIARLVKETGLAYEFTPGSYAWSAYCSALALKQTYDRQKAAPITEPPPWE